MKKRAVKGNTSPDASIYQHFSLVFVSKVDVETSIAVDAVYLNPLDFKSFDIPLGAYAEVTILNSHTNLVLLCKIWPHRACGRGSASIHRIWSPNTNSVAKLRQVSISRDNIQR